MKFAGSCDSLNCVFLSKDVTTPCSENYEKRYGIPSLEDLGHDTAGLGEDQFPGGEQEALRRLEEHMKRTVIQLHTCLTCVGRGASARPSAMCRFLYFPPSGMGVQF